MSVGSAVSSDVWESSSSLAGSSGTVIVTYSAGLGYISSVALYCLVTTTPTASSAATQSASGTSVSQSITIPSGGGGLAIVIDQNGHALTGFTNTATDVAVIVGGNTEAYAHITASGTPTITASTATTESFALSLVAWGP
jgi:hypothetical protein